MLSMIRRVIDAQRLIVELEAAEREITNLKEQLRHAQSGPSFIEVAKTFDASCIHSGVVERVVSDLSPILNEKAVRFLGTSMNQLARENDGPTMLGQAAFDQHAQMHHFRFECPAMGTTIKAI